MNEKIISLLKIMNRFPIKVYVDDSPVPVASEEEWSNFVSGYKVIHAAGGIVRDTDGSVLMIYRLGRWDFPKGKVEEGEDYVEAAVREVREETGATSLEVVCLLPETYHTYNINDTRILKITHWYLMSYSGGGELKPQTEEEISRAEWVGVADVGHKLMDSYRSLKELWEKTVNYLKTV